ncbi:membrane protein insertase YidC [Haloglycomyces albus]|uniref:membrane protein insertase YidC n=1 Tax=Haloglycomyces albus TaxID=526067 RepID=UPI00046D4D39|nr:membrane protein insertase YidC [Haloglycomyces albus]
MSWLYTAISWVLLRWHDLWDGIMGAAHSLNTGWAWLLSIVFVVITLRIVLFPLFVKQIRSQRAMQKLSPEIKALQERYKGDKETLQREMMALWKKEKANPLMGCLPILIQIPVFISLFRVLNRPEPGFDGDKTAYGWTTEQFNSFVLDGSLFGAPFWSSFRTASEQIEAVGADPLTVRIVAIILMIIMIATTYLTTRQMILKTGWNSDPTQRMVQKLMLYGIPVMLVFSGLFFPIGVVVYWTINNLFSLAQQQYVLRKYPPPSNNDPHVKPPKPGTKAHEKMVEEEKEAEERRKALAPKPGQKPKNTPKKKSAPSGNNNSKQSQSRAERIAQAKKVSGADADKSKKKK